MGWLWLFLLGGGAFGLLVLLGVARSLWSLVGAALMLGAAGYALQARPGLSASPASPVAPDDEVNRELSKMRLDMFGRYTYAEPYFAMSDGLIRSGARRSAVTALLGGLNGAPDNAALWTALGQAYVDHDGTLSPAARFAFGRAIQLAPEHPGPAFFYGVALFHDQRLDEALRWWARAYRLSPQATVYREQIGVRLVILDAFLKRGGAVGR